MEKMLLCTDLIILFNHWFSYNSNETLVRPLFLFALSIISFQHLHHKSTNIYIYIWIHICNIVYRTKKAQLLNLMLIFLPVLSSSAVELIFSISKSSESINVVISKPQCLYHIHNDQCFIIISVIWTIINFVLKLSDVLTNFVK